MGRLNQDQGQLFYSFCLADAVPDDHPIREIAAVLSSRLQCIAWGSREDIVTLTAFSSRCGQSRFSASQYFQSLSRIGENPKTPLRR